MEGDHSPRAAHALNNATQPETALSQVPRLRISHLLLWTFCSAAYLTMQRYWMSNVELSEQYDSARAITGLIEGIVNGSTLTGTIILFLACLKDGPPLFKSPGHWLIVAHAVNSFFLWFPSWIIGMLGEVSSDVIQSIFCCILSVTVAIYLLATRQYTHFRWRLFFAAIATLTLVKLIANAMLLTNLSDFEVFEWMHLAYSLGDIVLCLLLLVVATIDKRSHVHRDWLHWLGVVAFAVTQCSYLIWTVGLSFL